MVKESRMTQRGKTQIYLRNVFSYAVLWIEFCEILRVMTRYRSLLVCIDDQKPVTSSTTPAEGEKLVT